MLKLTERADQACFGLGKGLFQLLSVVNGPRTGVVVRAKRDNVGAGSTGSGGVLW